MVPIQPSGSYTSSFQFQTTGHIGTFQLGGGLFVRGWHYYCYCHLFHYDNWYCFCNHYVKKFVYRKFSQLNFCNFLPIGSFKHPCPPCRKLWSSRWGVNVSHHGSWLCAKDCCRHPVLSLSRHVVVAPVAMKPVAKVREQAVDVWQLCLWLPRGCGQIT